MPDDTRELRGVLDKAYYNTFIHLVNVCGVKQNRSQYLVGDLIVRGLRDKLKELKALDNPDEIEDLDMRLSVMCMMEKVNETRKTQLAVLASRCLDEAWADKIASLADQLGIDLDEIETLGKENPVAISILSEENNPDTKFGRCLIWLSKLFSNNCKIPRAKIGEMAEKEGYNNQMLQKCKRKLGLQHQKDGNIWYWTSPSMQKEPSKAKLPEMTEENPF